MIKHINNETFMFPIPNNDTMDIILSFPFPAISYFVEVFISFIIKKFALVHENRNRRANMSVIRIGVISNRYLFILAPTR